MNSLKRGGGIVEDDEKETPEIPAAGIVAIEGIGGYETEGKP